MRIAPAALAALGDHMRLLVGDVGEDSAGLFFLDDRAERHLDDEVLGVLAVAPAAASVFAALGDVFSFVAEVRQRGEIGVGNKDDVAALSAVAAVGTSCRHILFAVERHGAVAAVTGFYMNIRFIYKHSYFSLSLVLVGTV